MVSSYAYGHDNVGNRTSMTEANGDVTSYGYDAIYRLVSEEKRDSQQQTIYTYAYSYDGVGNRESMTANGAGTSYFYDDNNKLTSYVDAGGTTTFGHDSNGNTTSMVVPGPITWNYAYDYENRLAHVGNGGTFSATYTYSPDGLRLRIQSPNDAQYPDKWFQYDGVRPVLEGTLSGDTYTTINKYVWEADSYYDALVYALVGGAWRYYMYDGLGSTRQLTLHASPYTVTDTYSYEAFGNVLASTGTTPNPYQYVGSLGYYKSGDPHLLHLGARYYMPEVGRFTAVDALRGMNAYSYIENSPVGAMDPSGLHRATLEGKENDCTPMGACDPWGRDYGAILAYIRFIGRILAPGGREYLESLEGGGGRNMAVTRCLSRPGNTIFSPTWCGAAYWWSTPSERLCTRVHERVHRFQCFRLGPAGFSSPANWWVMEREAYEATLRCFQGLLRPLFSSY